MCELIYYVVIMLILVCCDIFEPNYSSSWVIDQGCEVDIELDLSR